MRFQFEVGVFVFIPVLWIHERFIILNHFYKDIQLNMYTVSGVISTCTKSGEKFPDSFQTLLLYTLKKDSADLVFRSLLGSQDYSFPVNAKRYDYRLTKAHNEIMSMMTEKRTQKISNYLRIHIPCDSPIFFICKFCFDFLQTSH